MVRENEMLQPYPLAITVHVHSQQQARSSHLGVMAADIGIVHE